MAKRTKTLSLLEGCFLREIAFEGTVFSGGGEGRKFIDLSWVKRQIEEKLGFTPYPGTLNIRLTAESVKRKKLLEKAEHFDIEPEKGYCRGILIKAKITALDCGIIVPQVPAYPSDVIEVVAPVFLRQRLHIDDRSEVCVLVTV